MTQLSVSELDFVDYTYEVSSEGLSTFVFINYSGASQEVWGETLLPGLRDKGFGTLTLDFRGQGKSSCSKDARLDAEEILADCITVLNDVQPFRPILVGLSIGGLHAARIQRHWGGAEALVLLNTLRDPGLYTAWISEIEHRLLTLGGLRLVHDVLRPLSTAPERLEKIRTKHLLAEPYEPVDPTLPRARYAETMRSVDWNFPWSELEVPVLILTGEHDHLYRRPALIEEIVSEMPKAREVIVEGGGHAMHVDSVSSVVQELTAFASGI